MLSSFHDRLEQAFRNRYLYIYLLKKKGCSFSKRHILGELKRDDEKLRICILNLNLDTNFNSRERQLTSK